MTVDSALVTRKLTLILGDLDILRAIAAKGVESYVRDRVDQAVVERYLERAIGRMIDVNYHVITEAGNPPPTDYHASFRQLVDLGILDLEFAKRIARAAGLRNRLVHEYDEIDAALVFEGLQSALRDVPTYASRINGYLSNEGGGIR